MKTSIKKNLSRKSLSLTFSFIILSVFLFTNSVYAHCDSYDGPVIKDAKKALMQNDVSFVLKWISEEQEKEIVSLFNKTYKLKDKDEEVYEIVEKHFFETLVRLHRATEGAPFSGLKPAGTTKRIIVMSDNAIQNSDIDNLLMKLDNHIRKVVKKKFNKVMELSKTKDISPEDGRKYVKAYVDYTHTLEEIHNVLEHDNKKHSEHKH